MSHVPDNHSLTWMTSSVPSTHPPPPNPFFSRKLSSTYIWTVSTTDPCWSNINPFINYVKAVPVNIKQKVALTRTHPKHSWLIVIFPDTFMPKVSLTFNILCYWKSLVPYYPIPLATVCVCYAHGSVTKPTYFLGCLPVWVLIPVWDVHKRCKQLLLLKRVHFLQKTCNFSGSQQPESSKPGHFAFFNKPEFDYDDNQMDIKIKSENDMLHQYHYCCWQVLMTAVRLMTLMWVCAHWGGREVDHCSWWLELSL